MDMEHSQEYLKREFMHFISDTLALLGGGEEIVDQIRKCEEKPITPELIEKIKGFNMKHIDQVKTRLALLNTITVVVR